MPTDAANSWDTLLNTQDKIISLDISKRNVILVHQKNASDPISTPKHIHAQMPAAIWRNNFSKNRIG